MRRCALCPAPMAAQKAWAGIDVACNDKASILTAADQIGATRGDTQIFLCGMRINLV